MMKKCVKSCGIAGVMLLLAGAAGAQSQYQTTFEVGVGYARPGIGRFDMVSLLLQSDKYLFESGIGIDINGENGGDTVFSWLIRGAGRAITLGNTLVHIGGEFSLHTNSTSDGGSLTTVAPLFGTSYGVTDHLNVAVHIFPIVFAFGNPDTVVQIAKAQLGAHLMF